MVLHARVGLDLQAGQKIVGFSAGKVRGSCDQVIGLQRDVVVHCHLVEVSGGQFHLVTHAEGSDVLPDLVDISRQLLIALGAVLSVYVTRDCRADLGRRAGVYLTLRRTRGKRFRPLWGTPR